MPGYLKVDAVEITAKENMGSEALPVYMVRFIGDVEFVEDTFEMVEMIGDEVTVVRPVMKSGDTRKVYGRVSFSLLKEQWVKKSLVFDESPTMNAGQRKVDFPHSVLDGSEAAKEARDKFERKQAEKAALIAAEAKRLKEKQTAFLEARKLKFGELAKLLGGDWKGSYICGQGETGLTLSMEGDDTGLLSAVFSFYPLSGTAPSGVFKMAGVFDEELKIKLEPEKWISRPDGYYMIDLNGVVDSKNNSMVGWINARGCSTFKLKKNSQI